MDSPNLIRAGPSRISPRFEMLSNASVLVEIEEDRPQGSDIQGLSADLLEAARRRNLSANSLAAYERTWTRFLA
jgi:hypothetical protein